MERQCSLSSVIRNCVPARADPTAGKGNIWACRCNVGVSSTLIRRKWKEDKATSELSNTAAECLNRIRSILAAGRRQAFQAINSAMVQSYWQVGCEIVEEEQRGAERAEYGARLIATLAEHLTREFGKGFTARNLAFMRGVYLAFPILHALRTELNWTHYRLLAAVQNPQARAFYEAECANVNWSTRELER
jgi:hypothetical protein